jgi:hypothetical protein
LIERFIPGGVAVETVSAVTRPVGKMAKKRPVKKNQLKSASGILFPWLVLRGMFSIGIILLFMVRYSL